MRASCCVLETESIQSFEELCPVAPSKPAIKKLGNIRLTHRNRYSATQLWQVEPAECLCIQRQSLRDDLVHVVVLVCRKASDKVHSGSGGCSLLIFTIDLVICRA